MGASDEFWADLLGHVRQQVLVTVTGPDVTVVGPGDTNQTLDSLIARDLAERYQLSVPLGRTTMGEAVAAVLRDRGHDEVDRLYRVINDIMERLDPAPGKPLRDLAAMTDLRLFVSTTPDRLLAQSLNDIRFQGGPARGLAFAPSRSTREQARDIRPAAASDTVVLRLFGKAASTPQYAIHDEDRLEWLHALLSDAASLPDWLEYPLKEQPMLFIGCDIPDWIGRFLVRMTSSARLSIERKQFFFVGNSASHAPSLSEFFATHGRKAQVQRLDMVPAAFVSELRSRWEDQRPAEPPAEPPPNPPTIFISYMREDVGAARRLHDAINDLGGDVWLDERRLAPGDDFEAEILDGIRRSIRLFIAIISNNTEREDEGYVFREWREAAERSRAIPRRRFIVPVVVDDAYSGDPSQFRQIPDDFARYHFGRAPGGNPDADLVSALTAEIRAMRRRDAM